MSDPLDLAELRRLEAAATPGPWVPQSRDDGTSEPWYLDTHAYEDGPEPVWAPPQYPVSLADARLIAALRNAAPALLAPAAAPEPSPDLDFTNARYSDVRTHGVHVTAADDCPEVIVGMCVLAAPEPSVEEPRLPSVEELAAALGAAKMGPKRVEDYRPEEFFTEYATAILRALRVPAVASNVGGGGEPGAQG